MDMKKYNKAKIDKMRGKLETEGAQESARHDAALKRVLTNSNLNPPGNLPSLRPPTKPLHHEKSSLIES